MAIGQTVRTTQLASKVRHFRGMCSSLLSDAQPTSLSTVPPLPHKWLTCAHVVHCLVVIALDPSRRPVRGRHLHQGPYPC